MSRNYMESAEDVVITADRARREVLAHDCDWAEFVAEVGEQDEYDAQVVLGWLGY